MNDDPISPSLINTICDEFEDAWQSGSEPNIQTFVERVEERKRPALIEQLLEIDIEFRTRNNQQVVPGTYTSFGTAAVEYAAVRLSEISSRAADVSPDEALKTVDHQPEKGNESNSSESNSKKIGVYKLLQKLGEGGMGEVWMAEQEKPVRRRVAVKIIKSGKADKKFVARFEAERQALALMEHQNIAKVLDAGTAEDGSPYLVMELVQGIPITEYCDLNKLTLQERLKLFVPVCHAIQHAHQKGILHRDLKPANVLVCIYDREPVPKVIDFGLAKSLQHQMKLTDKTMFTEYGQVIGTVQYMSPEQAVLDALDVDTRSDIYSLGVMLYELLAGSTPIDSNTIREQALLNVLKIVREKDPPRPSHRLSSSGTSLPSICDLRKIEPAKLEQVLRGDLDWIVMKALEKDRTRRYESANEFANDVDRFLNGETVIARPQSLGYRLSKFVSRNRGLVAAMLLIVTSLLAGIAGTSFGLFRAQAATEEAIEQRKVAEKKTVEASREKARADSERKRATEEAKKARAAALKSRQLLARQYAANGAASILQSDTNAALPWIGAAVELLEHDAFAKTRLVSALSQAAKVVGVFTHHARVNDICVSPDGRRIASTSNDGWTKVWELESGKEVARFNNETESQKVCFHPDGSMLLSTARESARVWNIETGKLVDKVTAESGIASADFGEAGQIFLSERDGNVGVWDLETGQSKLKRSSTANGFVNSNFNVALKQLVTCTEKALQIWSSETGELIKTLDRTAGASVALTYDDSNRRIGIATDRGTVEVWDARSFEQECSFQCEGCSDLFFDPNSNLLATVSGAMWFKESKVRVWDVETGEPVSSEFRQSTFATHVGFDSTSDRIVIAGTDGAVFVWDVAKDSLTNPLRLHHRGHVMKAFFGENDSLFTAGGLQSSGHVQAFELPQNSNASNDRSAGGESEAAPQQPKYRVDIDSESDTQIVVVREQVTEKEVARWVSLVNPRKAVVSSRDEVVVFGNSDSVEVFELNAKSNFGLNKPKHVLKHPYPSRAIYDVAMDDAGFVVTGVAKWNGEGFAQRWNLETGQVDGPPLLCGGYVESVAITKSGSLISAGSHDHTATVWDSLTGEVVVPPIRHSEAVSLVHFSDDESILLTVSGKSVFLWDIESTQLIAKKGHAKAIKSVRFDLENWIVAITDAEQTNSNWNVRLGDGDLEELKLKTRLYSGKELNQDGYLESVNPEKLRSIWIRLLGK